MQIEINYNSHVPIYVQLRNQIIIGISDGEFQAGEQLPTTRALASQLGINTMTVNKAYQQLKLEGYIVADRRKGAVVKDVMPETKRKSVVHLSQEAKERFRVLVSEAQVQGVDIDEIIQLCKEYYDRS